MKPGRTNYEIWILNYLDGLLNDEQTGLLMKFLDENPDIKEEFRFLENYKAKPYHINYPNKNKLKKSISDLSEDQFELLCVSTLENDLSAEQAAELISYIDKHPDRKKTFNQIQKIKLFPPYVKFRYKNKIRKSGVAEKTIRFLIPALSAAACMAVIIWISLKGENGIKNSNNKSDILNKEVTINPESIVKTEISADVIKEVITSQINHKSAPGKIVAQSPSIQISEQVIDMYHEKIPLPILSFKENLVLHQIKIDSIKPAVKYTSPTQKNAEANHGVKYHLAKFVREKILNTDLKSDEAIKSYEIAEAGIKGLNKILGWQMSFNEYTDEKGELMAINFNSKLLKLNIPVKRNESDE